MKNLLIRLNNHWARRRLRKVPMSALILLAPHCLQRRSCDRKVRIDLDECARCGECDLAGLLELRERYGVRGVLASGGRQALQTVRSADVRGVIAIACEKELIDGICAAFPKPVLGICNRRPEGPCLNTRVDLQRVDDALRTLARADSRGAPLNRTASGSRGPSTAGQD